MEHFDGAGLGVDINPELHTLDFVCEVCEQYMRHPTEIGMFRKANPSQPNTMLVDRLFEFRLMLTCI